MLARASVVHAALRRLWTAVSYRATLSYKDPASCSLSVSHVSSSSSVSTVQAMPLVLSSNHLCCPPSPPHLPPPPSPLMPPSPSTTRTSGHNAPPGLPSDNLFIIHSSVASADNACEGPLSIEVQPVSIWPYSRTETMHYMAASIRFAVFQLTGCFRAERSCFGTIVCIAVFGLELLKFVGSAFPIYFHYDV